MSSQKSGLTPAKKAYDQAKQSLKTHPVIFTPFLIFSAIEFITLIILYLAPRMPLKLLLGPPIQTVWGENFLHYPVNFLLLPKLASLNRMGLAIIFGWLLTGVAVAMVYDAFSHRHLNLENSFKTAFKKYLSLFTLALALTLTLYILNKIISLGLLKYFMSGHTRLLFISSKLWLGPFLLCANFILAVFIQAALAYVIPILIIEKEKLIKAIIKSFALFKKFFLSTLALVGIPMFLYIPIMILNYKASFLIQNVFPEFVLWVAFLGIIVSSLVIDAIVTVSTTILYLQNKEG